MIICSTPISGLIFLLQLMVGSLIIPVNVYATAEPQAEVQHEFSNEVPMENVVYGARVVNKPKTVHATISNAELSIPKARFQSERRLTNEQIIRRYDSLERPAAQQLVRQYDIPIVHKTVEDFQKDAINKPLSGIYTPAPRRQEYRKKLRENKELISNGTTISKQSQQYHRNANDSNNSHERQRGYSANIKNNASMQKLRKKPKPYISGTTTPTVKATKTATTPIAITTIATTTTPPFENFHFSNPFEVFAQNVWNFFNPTSTPPTLTSPQPPPTKKPPKKFTPMPSYETAKNEKLSHQKYNYDNRIKTVPSTTMNRSSTDGPFRIALPTFSFFQTQLKKENDKDIDKDKGKRDISIDLRNRFLCPRESEVRFQLFPKICKTDSDCSVWNREELCCDIFGAKSCVSGIAKPLEETSHMPILGFIPRKCPTRPLAELWWDVKECETDMDCWPRVCCPDGRHRYCRTSQPELDTVPVPVQRSFNYLTEYLECTPPPPPIFDLHPKACTSTLDCFPNVCCQEAGLRHCRPPKKSVLTLMANVFNVDFVKRITQNIVIK